MIRVGIVGAGSHSTDAHGPALARCRDEADDVELAAVCDLERSRAEAYAERFGFDSVYEDVDAMYDRESLDAVFAITPVSATRSVAGDLLGREVPVLIEKPPGRTVEETRELRALADRTETPHAVSFNRRFNPALERAREWLAGPAPAGPPTLAVSRMLRTDRFEEGFLIGTAIHAVDTVCSVLGLPDRVTTRRWRSRDGGTGGGECCVGRASFGDATGEFVVVPDAGTHAETCELIGPGYTVRVDIANAGVSVSSDGEEALSWRLPDDEPRHVRDGTFAETKAFLDAVRRDGGFGPTLDSAVPSMALASAMDAGDDRTID